ncbi:MAG: cupin domain-containing protein [Synergistales bacterium]|nr:cupin domain-containing protein [Synergistales bacterium]
MFSIAELVAFQKDSVVSRTLIEEKSGTVTIFAFDKGQGLSEHTAPYHALVQVLEGRVVVNIGGESHEIEGGRSIIMPAGVPHSMKAVDPFKMMLTMIRN